MNILPRDREASTEPWVTGTVDTIHELRETIPRFGSTLRQVAAKAIEQAAAIKPVLPGIR